MEISRVLFRPVQSFSGGGFDTHLLQPSFSSLSTDIGKRFSGELRFLGSRDSTISLRSRNGFSDNGHLQYYVSPNCGGRKREKGLEIATIKKTLKPIKGLWKKLSMLSNMGFVEVDNGFVGDDKGKTISETADVLLTQLQKLRAEEKELKRKRKEEKAKLKAAWIKARGSSGSSSSSSESSDSECGQVINMRQLRNVALAEPQAASGAEASVTSTSLQLEEQRTTEGNEDHSSMSCGQECCCGSSAGNSTGSGEGTRVAQGPSTKRIKVCMGPKCRKLGAAALLGEFERRVGIKGAVVGCKCTGKCRDGPNVRISNQHTKNSSDRVDEFTRSPTNNPLCLGVGLEDVGEIVANCFRDEKRDLGDGSLKGKEF